MFRTLASLTAATLIANGLATAQSAPCPGEGNCYESNGSPGCEEISCCLFICAADPFCCNSTWDSLCAASAQQSCTQPCPSECVGDLNGSGTVDGADLGALLNNWGKAGCGDLDSDGKIDGSDLGALLNAWGPCPLFCGSAFAGDCCSSNGSPFCNDETCCELVCASDPFCCNTTWDSACANAAQVACEVCPGCGNDFAGDCCSSNGSPFCNDETCCELVCTSDPFCCSTTWDSACANAAQVACEVCPGCGNDFAGNCFAVNGSPYCDILSCCESVCAVDPFCCTNTWDGACVNQAGFLCAAN